jgi:prepilin peptidase CpaA
MNLLQAAFLTVFPALVIVAALRDLTSFTIPNWISAGLAVAFLPAALLAGLPGSALGMHALIGLIGFAAAIAMFAFGWIGGGDAKLFAASALWLGWPAAGAFALITGLAGGALAVGLLGVRTDWVRAHAPAVPGWAQRLMEPNGPAPYGVAIACGALAAFPASDLITAFQGSL